ncbi:MAG TPA: hypothetical protein VFB67_04300 [Candidatus Polarisedimenticolaceae bacterium]|nr:hypothetical protein [Candidatus Polarisedimenticolaceae bacterium]
MHADAARVALWTLGVYLGVGTLIGVPFVITGIGRIDAAARGTPWTFRVLVLPGVIALWPFIARRWAAVGRGR